MKQIRLVVALMLSAASLSAFAAPHLTPQECNSYPFIRLSAPITHKMEIQELSELESVGWTPRADDIHYPTDIQQAQARLRVVYRQDCSPMAHASVSTQKKPG